MADQLTAQDGPKINADLYLRHAQELDKHTRGKDGYVSKMRGVRKEMKQDGVNLTAFNLVRKLATFDEEDRMALLEAARRYAGWEGLTMPPAWRAGNNEQPQGGMFEDEPSAEAKKAHRDNKIAMDAWNSRKAGGPRDNNPHNPVSSSEDHQIWDAAWRKADKEFGKSVPIAKKAPEEAAPPGDDDKPGGPRHEPEVAAAKKRGRPTGSGKKKPLDHLEAARKRLDGEDAVA